MVRQILAGGEGEDDEVGAVALQQALDAGAGAARVRLRRQLRQGQHGHVVGVAQLAVAEGLRDVDGDAVCRIVGHGRPI